MICLIVDNEKKNKQQINAKQYLSGTGPLGLNVKQPIYLLTSLPLLQKTSRFLTHHNTSPYSYISTLLEPGLPQSSTEKLWNH